MKERLKKEMVGLLQFCAIGLVAGLLHFMIAFGSIPGINVALAWRGYAPLLWWWLMLFAALGCVRLLLVLFLAEKGKTN